MKVSLPVLEFTPTESVLVPPCGCSPPRSSPVSGASFSADSAWRKYPRASGLRCGCASRAGSELPSGGGQGGCRRPGGGRPDPLAPRPRLPPAGNRRPARCGERGPSPMGTKVRVRPPKLPLPQGNLKHSGACRDGTESRNAGALGAQRVRHSPATAPGRAAVRALPRCPASIPQSLPQLRSSPDRSLPPPPQPVPDQNEDWLPSFTF